MEREQVVSSQIRSIGYDPKTQVLEVEFIKGSSVYQYSGVPSDEHAELMNSASVGSYFAANIKNSYPYRKVS